ncbi:MAG: molybdenum ABC transporter ATP-binding protein [Candidatus Sumerlaeia bacterium]
MLEMDIQTRCGDFDLHVECRIEDRVAGIFGPSGAGKTSLLNTIAGLDTRAQGFIRLDGESLFDSRQGQQPPTHARRIGMVFQDSRLFPHYTVEGNLRYGEKPAGASETDNADGLASFDEVVSLLDLTPLLQRRPRQLSGGEKRRVAIGRALLASPRLLLLDEPLTGLQIELRQQILGFLRRVHHQLKIPMLIVSHRMDEILSLTDSLLLLDKGHTLASGKYLDLVQQADLLGRIGVSSLTNMLHLEVEQHQRESNQTLCKPVLAPGQVSRIAGGRRLPLIKTTLREIRPGERIDLSLPPRDISLSLKPMPDTSIDNQVLGKILRLIPIDDRVMCLVDAGVQLLIDVGSSTARAMELEEGLKLWCLFRADAMRPA